MSTVSRSTSPTEPVSTRRIAATARLLGDHPTEILRILARLDDDQLAHVAEAIRQEQRARAVARGDHDEIIADAFEVGFGGDGLGVRPWREGNVIVCPGGIITKSRTSHRCRFVSVDDTWIWDSPELIREDKRSSPGANGGFRAVALIPVIDGTNLDVVSGRARAGQHQVDHVVSLEVRRGELVEIAQRTVATAGMQ